MGTRIEVMSRGNIKPNIDRGLNLASPIKVYNINGELTTEEQKIVEGILADPIAEIVATNSSVLSGLIPEESIKNPYALMEVSPKPGVNDPEGNLVQKIIEKQLGKEIAGVSFGQQHLWRGSVSYEEFDNSVKRQIGNPLIHDIMMTPLVQEMKKQGREYKGFLYAAVIMAEEGPKIINLNPKILEYNCRFGDPEAQPSVMMFKDGLFQPISAALDGKLDEINVEFKPGAACCVVLASQGYPGNYKKGLPIEGLEEVAKLPDVKVFHAGTAIKDGKIITAGGRVLGVTAYSPNGIKDAKEEAYNAVSKISIPGGFHYRKDIADKALR